MLCGTNNIMQIFHYLGWIWEKFCMILLISQNIVMDIINVMSLHERKLPWIDYKKKKEKIGSSVYVSGTLPTTHKWTRQCLEYLFQLISRTRYD